MADRLENLSAELDVLTEEDAINRLEREYTIGVEAKGQVGNETVESVKKTITLRVAAKSSITGNVLLIGGLIVLVVAMGLVSIRISRR